MENVKWAYFSKETLGDFLENFREVEAWDDVMDDSDSFIAKIANYKKTKKKDEDVGKGFAKFPLYMVYEDFEAHRNNLDYSYETHGLLVAITMLLSTYVSRGRGIKTSTLRNHFGHNLFFYRDLIEKYGRPYCLKWHFEYDPKQFRNRHYVTFNEELLQIKSIEAGGMK